LESLLPKLILRTLGSSQRLKEIEEECRRLLDSDQNPFLTNVVFMHQTTRILIVDADGIPKIDTLLTREQEDFDLLISLDAQVFDHPTLLARCRQVLLSPFSGALLERHIHSIYGDETRDPLMSELLERNIIGQSACIERLRLHIPLASKYEAPVAIYGETGTGKELVARAVHYCSVRKDNSFVPVNCAALNDELLLAELFGHKRGAFTDAHQARRGLVAQADGGTLFLDEVDSLSTHAQGALLRFLQDREYRPIGSEETLHADIRVVCATNRVLRRCVEKKEFREDLFYRLNVIELSAPSLRQRLDDIETLSQYFLHQFALQYNEPEKYLHRLTLQWMYHYDWPGNVRELENHLHRGFVMSSGPSICTSPINGDSVTAFGTDQMPKHSGKFQQEKARVVDQFERDYLIRMLKVTNGNLSMAARKAGKERKSFSRLVKKHGIDRHLYIAEGINKKRSSMADSQGHTEI
jgi:DNA-binding NtrC family response regulator